MNKNDPKNIRADFGIVIDNLKSNDLILIIVDYQQNIVNEQNSDISSMTDDEKEDDIVDTCVSQTSLKTEPIPVPDGDDIDLDEINAVEDDRTEIGYTLKEKTAKFTEMCSK